MGNTELYQIMQEKDKIYSKPEFTEKDGMIAAKLEERFAELDRLECRNRCNKNVSRAWNKWKEIIPEIYQS